LQVAWLMRLLQQPWLYAALFSYFGAFLTYMTLLRHAPVGPAFAVTQLAVVTVLIYSVMFLGEHMSAGQIVGSLLIMCGIYLLGEEPEKVLSGTSEAVAPGSLPLSQTSNFKS
jgi:drug/metabolite transporter (DMT)-like permease